MVVIQVLCETMSWTFPSFKLIVSLRKSKKPLLKYKWKGLKVQDLGKWIKKVLGPKLRVLDLGWHSFYLLQLSHNIAGSSWQDHVFVFMIQNWYNKYGFIFFKLNINQSLSILFNSSLFMYRWSIYFILCKRPYIWCMLLWTK